MGLSVFRTKCALGLGGLLALTVGAGSIQATVLSSSATATAAITATISCNTATGPAAPASFTVHAFPAPSSGTTYTVGFTPLAGIVVTAPSAVVLSSTTNTTGLVFKVAAVAGCASSSSPTTTFSLQMTVATNAGSPASDVHVAVTDTVTAATSALTPAASSVTITCGYSSTGPVYVPGAPKTISLTSAASGGTPYTVVPGTISGGVLSPAALPTWLTVTPTGATGTAGVNASSFTVQAASGSSPSTGCGTFAGSTMTYALPITSPPAPPITVTVTLVSTAISPLTVTPVPAAPSISMSYVKFSGSPAVANVLVTSTLAGAYFTVNTATLPIWLTVSTTGAVVPSGGEGLRFSTTSTTDSMAPGTYTATVFLQVAGYADTPVPVTLLVTNKPPTLSVSTPNPMGVTYTLGGSTPVSTITVASSDSPIPYTMTFGGTLAPMLTAGEEATGIAYSFGSNISITYNPLLFATSAPGTVLTGTVTFTWGNPVSVIVVTINLTVASPAATLTSISPATLPTAAPGTVFSVTLTGSGFVGGTDPTLATRVGIVATPGTITPDTNLNVTYINPSNLTVTITVPALGTGGVNGDPNLPFLVGGAGGQVTLGLVNGTSTIPTGTAPLNIGGGPIIYGVTSSSSFTEVSGGNLPQVAPYDMVSIWGANFCSSQATFPSPIGLNGGCTSTTVLAGVPTAPNYIFPFTLSPDQYIAPTPPASSSWRTVSVTFFPHGTTTGGLAAPLLFATNGQINTIVPGAVVTTSGTKYDVVVNFGCATCTPSTVVSSAPFTVNTVATDPGIYTIGSDGQGPAAALANGTYALISAANPAGMRSGSSNSDTIQLYVTGLGVPNSVAAYSSGTGACIAPLGGGYLAALNITGLTNIDGAVLLDNLFPGDLPPCFNSGRPTATIGGVSATVSYAAFVGDTIAGLYQINMQLPRTDTTLYPNWPSMSGSITSLVTPTNLPVYITTGGVTSQTGVMLPVAPELKVTPPTGISGLAVGMMYTGNVTATLGSGTYTYAITSGVLPAGLTLTTSGNLGVISGRPAANTAGTYMITVTATDTATYPLTGSVSFTLTVAGGLYMTLSGSATPTTAGTANTTASQVVTPTGGTYPYTFVVTVSLPSAGSPAPAGMSFLPSGGTSSSNGSSGTVQTTSATPAGTYHVTVTATDATGTVTGASMFDVVVGLALSLSPGSPISDSITTLGPAGLITTVTATGGSGTYTYSIDPASNANFTSGGLTMSGNQLKLGSATTGSGQTVIIDVIDTGTPPTGGIDTLSPGTQITLTLTLTT